MNEGKTKNAKGANVRILEGKKKKNPSLSYEATFCAALYAQIGKYLLNRIQT
jgi:hypothetical protein